MLLVTSKGEFYFGAKCYTEGRANRRTGGQADKGGASGGGGSGAGVSLLLYFRSSCRSGNRRNWTDRRPQVPFTVIQMYKKAAWSYYWLLASLMSSVANSEEKTYIMRQTNYGVIKGYVDKIRVGKEVEKYLGVPYAQPPIGDLRFEVSVVKK